MDENVIKKVMPQSLSGEQSVVGAMIANPAAIDRVSERITKEDFYHSAYGTIFETLVELSESKRGIDVVTISDALKKKGLPEDMSSPGFLGELAVNVPTTTNIEYYADIVREKSLLRRIITVNEGIAASCYAGEGSADEILDSTEKAFSQLLMARGVSEFTPIGEIVDEALMTIEAAGKKGGNITGIPTGFRRLDFSMSGLQPSDLILIAARPSMGKTAFALNIAEHVAAKEEKCVAIFSLEMSKVQLVNRLFAMESRVEAQKLRTGNLGIPEWEMLMEGASVVGTSKLIIDDTPGIMISELRSKCRKYKVEHGLDLVIIDYLQLIEAPGKESQQQKISDISRALKGIARELNVPVIALSQLNRGVEQREDKRPMLSDLRDSGAIEQDADVVMFIYRDDYYNKDSEKKGVTEIIIAKQRNGPIGTTELAWIPEYTLFRNLERDGRDSN